MTPLPALAARTVEAALGEAVRRLGACGILGARLDARLLVAACLGWPMERVIGAGDARLDAESARRLAALLERRAGREPMSQILGAREFWSLNFAVTRDVLTPRPESEEVVAAVLDRVQDRTRALRVVDLGTGSGCLLLALLSELPRAWGVGIDRSPRAVAVARANAARLGLAERAAFVVGDWGTGLGGGFDLAVANPPYIADSDIENLPPEVRLFEPPLALAGGPDGLAAYRRLAPDLVRLLAPAGLAALEVGAGQAEAVEAILGGTGLECGGRRRDLGGHERCILAVNSLFPRGDVDEKGLGNSREPV